MPSSIASVAGVLFKRNFVIKHGEVAPERMRVLAVLCRVQIDLRLANVPRYGPLEIPITCWWGTIDIQIPDHWAVVAGRVFAARSVELNGMLDSDQVFNDPVLEDQSEALAEISSERAAGRSSDGIGTAVVIHLMGVGGRVIVRR